MKSKVFNKEKLIEARDARGLTQIALSESVNVTKQHISSIETGKKIPTNSLLNEISKSLQVPLDFFYKESITLDESVVFYRHMHATTNTARRIILAKLKWLIQINNFLDEFIEKKEIVLPPVEIDEPLKLSFDDIDDFAITTRKFWGLGLGPISDLTLLLENNGFIIGKGSVYSDKLDGCSFHDKNTDIRYILLALDKENPTRTRFDLAHELGHHILHKNIIKTNITSTQDFKLIEDQAHRFASSFLFPEPSFVQDLTYPSLDELLLLKNKWKISISAMIFKLKDLGIIDTKSCTNLYIQMSKKGWRKNEPLDDILEMEEPVFLKRSIKLLISEGILTKDDILNEFSLYPQDIQALTQIEESYFTKKNNDLEIKLKDNIVNFPSIFK